MRYVYVLKNLVNGKVYVGQTYNIERRKRAHFSAARHGNFRPLYQSIRKHGETNFVIETLEECDDSLVDEREKYWVTHFDSCNPEKGYNLTPGGQGVTNKTRVLLSEVNKGVNNPMFGRKRSENTRTLLKQGWKTHIEKKFGEKILVTETRTCKCGTKFEVTFASNRKYHVKKFCSRRCANSKIVSSETKQKISVTLRQKSV